MTLTLNPGEIMTHTRAKIKFKGHSVQMIEWKQTDRQTDRRTDMTDRITLRANAVDNYYSSERLWR